MLNRHKFEIATLSTMIFALCFFITSCTFPRIRIGADSFGPLRAEYTEKIKKNIPAEGIETIRVKEKNGSVLMKFGATGTVEIEAVKVIHAVTERAAKEQASDFKMITTLSGAELDIGSEHPKWLGGRVNGQINYIIRVPEGVDVFIKSNNGEITIEPGARSVSLFSDNGEISTAGVKGGKVYAESDNGRVNIKDSDVPVKVKTDNGNINVSGCGGPATLETDNGRIEYNTDKPPNGNLDFKTDNGAIAVHLPENSDIEIRASAHSGSISIDLPIGNAKAGRKEFSGVMNHGTYKLMMNTDNGAISVHNSNVNVQGK